MTYAPFSFDTESIAREVLHRKGSPGVVESAIHILEETRPQIGGQSNLTGGCGRNLQPGAYVRS